MLKLTITFANTIQLLLQAMLHLLYFLRAAFGKMMFTTPPKWCGSPRRNVRNCVVTSQAIPSASPPEIPLKFPLVSAVRSVMALIFGLSFAIIPQAHAQSINLVCNQYSDNGADTASTDQHATLTADSPAQQYTWTGSLAGTYDENWTTSGSSGYVAAFAWEDGGAYTYNNANNGVRYVLSGEFDGVDQFQLTNDYNFGSGQSDGIKDFSILLYDGAENFLGKEDFSAANSNSRQQFSFSQTYNDVVYYDLVIHDSYTRAPLQFREVAVQGTAGLTCANITIGSEVIFKSPVDLSDSPADGATAPDGTATTSYGETSHTVESGIQLGAANDADSVIISSTDASGDGAEDDGVTIPTLTVAQSATISVDVTQAAVGDGYLQGWIDFNGNGDFADAGEQIATDLQYTAGITGTISVPISVPADAITTANSFARFRWSTTAGLDSTSAASDGETEEYSVSFADDPYTPTTIAGVCDVEHLDFDGINTNSPSVGSLFTGRQLTTLDQAFPGATFSVEITDVTGSAASSFAEIRGTDSGDFAPARGNGGTLDTRITFSEPIDFAIDDDSGLSGHTGDKDHFTFSLDSGTYQIIDPGTPDISIVKLLSGAMVLNMLHGDNDWEIRFAGVSGLSVDYDSTSNDNTAPLNFSICTPETDRSDAPADSSTAPDGTATTSYGEAEHTLIGGIQMGVAVDHDAASVASADASGDGADDDGVTIPALTQSDNTSITVNVTQAAASDGYLQGWIDFNGDGDFADAGEQIATDLQYSAGTTGDITVPFTVPADAISTAATFARFRWSSTSGLDSNNAASDGEVEDYSFTIEEAPLPIVCSVGTLSSGNFYLDNITAGDVLYDGKELGAPTGTLNGTANSANGALLRSGEGGTATYLLGDNINPAASGALLDLRLAPTSTLTDYAFAVSEDGVNFTDIGSYQRGSDTLNRYVDVQYAVPASIAYAKYLRVTRTGGNLYLDAVSFGQSCELPVERSDAPADVTSAPDGSATTSYGETSHTVASGLQLGAAIDADSSSITSADASADGSDDDGVTIPSLTQRDSATFTVNVTQIAASTGYLQGWIDWNGDGDFADADEQIATDLQYSAGTTGDISIALTVPSDAITSADTFARFRWSSASGLDSNTAARDGEVEDYQISIAPPIITCSAGTLTTGNFYLDSRTAGDVLYDGQELGPHNGTLNGSPNRFNGALFSTGVNSTATYLLGDDFNPAASGTVLELRLAPTSTFTDYAFAVSEDGVNFIDIGSYQRRSDDTLNRYVDIEYVVPASVGYAKYLRVTRAGGDMYLDAVGFGQSCLITPVTLDRSDAPADGGTAPDGSATTSYGETEHTIVSGIQLGVAIDGDTASITNADASGDGADDDGVTIPTLTQGDSANITVNVTQAAASDGYLQGWIDFNGDGDFADAGEQIATDLQYSAGTTGNITVPVTIPSDAIYTADTFARFRWSTTSGLDSTAFASDGEVEDYSFTIIEGNPSLAIQKNAPSNADEDSSSSVTLGDTLTYTVTATNDGNVTLSDVKVSDALITPDEITCASVAPGATCVLTGTYSVTQADVDAGSVNNTATTTSPDVTDPTTSPEVVTPTEQAPSLAIEKLAPVNADEDSSSSVTLGDTLTYTITATNDGNVTLSDVKVSDALITPDEITCASVAPGATCVLTGTYSVTQADVDAGSVKNTATTTSPDITGPTTSPEVTTSTAQNPSLAIQKNAPSNADEDSSSSVTLGDTLTYTVTATNDGNVTLSDVKVSDALITPDEITCASVAPGTTCVLTGTYSVTQADVDAGSVKNTATTTSPDITGPTTSPEVTTSTAQAPSLAIEKLAPTNADEDSSSSVTLGDTLTYTVTATNDGNVTLSDVKVSDALITPDEITCASVAPGTTCVLTGTYSVTQADVDAGSVKNTATTTSPDITDPTTSPEVTTSTAQAPSLAIEKLAPVNADEDASSSVTLGDTLTYTVTATNDGNVTLSDVKVSDALITPDEITCASVAPGATCVLTGTYSVTQADVDAGSVKNTATTTSPDVTDPTTSPEVVTPTTSIITAGPDTASGINGAAGQENVLNVFTNDVINGTQAGTDNGTLTVAPGSQVPAELNFDPATGNVSVNPGTPADSYSFEYQVCEIRDPTNCRIETVTIEVAASEIAASDDEPAPVRSGIGSSDLINALTNDTLNGEPVSIDDVTVSIVTPASTPGVVLDPATGLVSVDPSVPAGIYVIEYQICETLNPDNCSTASVTITVEIPVSNVSGTVYSDLNGNADLDTDEPGRGGWTVVLYRDGEVVGRTTTDAQGNYNFDAMPSGAGYSIGFYSPENGVHYGSIDELTLTDNETVVDQNLPLDPSGVVYDAVTREPVAGAVATLVDAGGKTKDTTSFGERKGEFVAFASDPGTVPGREEFRGTGGSLYFLKRQDVSIGSERVRIEIRDRETGLILETNELNPQQDYDFDPFQGRLTLLKPLASTASSGSTVREGSSTGNVPVLVVRYEYYQRWVIYPAILWVRALPHGWAIISVWAPPLSVIPSI